jgi:hypothetical protein
MLGSRRPAALSCKLMPNRLLLLVLSFALVLATGCGGAVEANPASSSTDVDQLLRDTFRNVDKLTSASVDAKLAIDGQGQSVSARLSGPYQSQGKGKLPKFQLAATLQNGAQSFSAGATWTGDKGFVNVQGTDYALSGLVARQVEAGYEQAAKQQKQAQGGAVLGALGIDFTKWLRNARNEGDAQVGDTQTIKLSGDADVARVIDDVQQLADRARTLKLPGTGQVPQKLTAQQRQEIVAAVKKLSIEVYTGKADRILRRVVVAADLQDPSSKSVSHVALDVTLSNVGADQQFTEPKGAKPFSALLKVTDQLKGLGAALGSSGSSPSSGTAAAPSAATLDKYTKCIEKSQGDSTKAQKCADLLGG